jgi:hypothetical protein
MARTAFQAPLRNMRPSKIIAELRCRLFAVTKTLRPPPDALATWGERVLALVAVAFVATLLTDIVMRGL